MSLRIGLLVYASFLGIGSASSQTTTTLAAWPPTLAGSSNFYVQRNGAVYPLDQWFLKGDQLNFNNPNSNPPYDWIPGSWDPGQDKSRAGGDTGLKCSDPNTFEIASWMPGMSSFQHTTGQVCLDTFGGYTQSTDIPKVNANKEDHQMIQATYIPSAHPVVFPKPQSTVTYSMNFQPHFWALPVFSQTCSGGAPDTLHNAYSQMSLLFDFCPNGVLDLQTKISFQPSNFTACAVTKAQTGYGQDSTTGNYAIEPKIPDMDPRDVPAILTANSGTTTLTSAQTAFVFQSYTVSYQQFLKAIDFENAFASPAPNPKLDHNPANWCWENAHINTETHYVLGETPGVEFGWSVKDITITNTVPP